MPVKSAFFYDYPPADGDVFGLGRRERIAGMTDLYAEDEYLKLFHPFERT